MNNQMPQPPALFQASEPIDITLTAQEWNVVLAGLYELPYRIAQPTVDGLRRQLMTRQSVGQSQLSGLSRDVS